MRLTGVLLKESYRWQFKQLWKTKGRLFDRPPILPTFIKDQEIKVLTAEDILKKPSLPKWEPPVTGLPLFEPERSIKDLPDYHEEPVYEYSNYLRLIEGEKQACLLTKTQPFFELPECVSDLKTIPELPDQDMLVQRVIMQANVWDPTKKKLPKRSNKQLPGWNYKAEYGIPQHRTSSIMINNLIRLCEMLDGGFDNSRQIVTEPYLSVFYYLRDNQHVMVRGKSNLMVYSNRPLKPFADEELVDASTQHQLPDLYPLLPTIDLKKQHVWRSENITGLKAGSSHPYPHTLFMNYGVWPSASQRNASMLMFSFGHALALAKQKYGMDAKELPEPIPIQCVMTDGVKFLFSCFQLNTLNYSSGDGIKNFVWFDPEGDRSMYNKIVPKRAMLRNTQYEDYDPDVFRQIATFYMNGATSNSVNIETEQRTAAVQQS